MDDKTKDVPEKREGTYYDCVFSHSTNKKIDSIIKDFGLEKDFNDAYHCTLTYSKIKRIKLKTSKGLPQKKGGRYKDYNCYNKVNIIAKIKSFGHFPTEEGKNLHIVLDCDWCEKQHDRSIKAGCTFDYDKYTPHVSLMYECGDFDIEDNKELCDKYIGETIYIVEERISPLNFNWVEDSKNKDPETKEDKEDKNEPK